MAEYVIMIGFLRLYKVTSPFSWTMFEYSLFGGDG